MELMQFHTHLDAIIAVYKVRTAFKTHLGRVLVPRRTVRLFGPKAIRSKPTSVFLTSYPDFSSCILCLDFLSLTQQMSNATIISLHPDCKRASLPNAPRVPKLCGRKQSWKSLLTAFYLSAGWNRDRLSLSARWNAACVRNLCADWSATVSWL